MHENKWGWSISELNSNKNKVRIVKIYGCALREGCLFSIFSASFLAQLGIIFALNFAVNLVFATDINGRLTVGGYVASEQISLPTSLASNNDVETLSARAYLKITDFRIHGSEIILDLRDKNDFFGNVDKQNLTLTSANNFQVHQLSTLIPTGPLFTKLGRFPVNEAGAVTDGAEVGSHLSKTFQTAVFAGFNPRVPGQKYYLFNSESRIYGTYLVYQPNSEIFGHSFYFSNAFVSERVGADTDRNYWFENLTYQWSLRSRILLLSYLDFVPNTYVQNGSFQWQQALTEKWSASTNLISVDVIGYAHLQGIRSLLPSSPYHEESEFFRYAINDQFWTEFRFISGQRLIDGLNRTDFVIATDYSNFGGRRWDTSFQIGYSNDFQSKDTFFKFGVSYFSRKWEFSLDEEIRNAVYSDGTYHPITTDINLTRAFRNDFFAILGAQDIIDERVKIIAGFFKLTYRFGSSSMAPIRDGAPPRGRL